MRLAKYAARGFAVLVPGVDRKKIDFSHIQQTQLCDLKGLARFIKVSAATEIATPFKWRENADGQENFDLVPHEQPRLPLDNHILRVEARKLVSEDADRLTDLLDRLYDDDDDVRTSKCIMPQVYPVGGGNNNVRRRLWSGWWHGPNHPFPNALETRDPAWQEIEDAGENPPQSVPRLLNDSWDISKRSREYLNGQMDKYDLDNVYYSGVYFADEIDG